MAGGREMAMLTIQMTAIVIMITRFVTVSNKIEIERYGSSRLFLLQPLCVIYGKNIKWKKIKIMETRLLFEFQPLRLMKYFYIFCYFNFVDTFPF